MDIAAFITARLDEDAALAHDADITSEPWRIDPYHDGERIDTADPASMFTIYDEGGTTGSPATARPSRRSPKNSASR